MDMLLDGEWQDLDKAAWEEYKKKLGLVLTTEVPQTTEPLTSTDGSSSGPSEPAQAPEGSA
jgi:hypothetical protein